MQDAQWFRDEWAKGHRPGTLGHANSIPPTRVMVESMIEGLTATILRGQETGADVSVPLEARDVWIGLREIATSRWDGDRR